MRLLDISDGMLMEEVDEGSRWTVLMSQGMVVADAARGTVQGVVAGRVGCVGCAGGPLVWEASEALLLQRKRKKSNEQCEVRRCR